MHSKFKDEILNKPNTNGIFLTSERIVDPRELTNNSTVRDSFQRSSQDENTSTFFKKEVTFGN
jgi:hypothetical protein